MTAVGTRDLGQPEPVVELLLRVIARWKPTDSACSRWAIFHAERVGPHLVAFNGSPARRRREDRRDNPKGGGLAEPFEPEKIRGCKPPRHHGFPAKTWTGSDSKAMGRAEPFPDAGMDSPTLPLSNIATVRADGCMGRSGIDGCSGHPPRTKYGGSDEYVAALGPDERQPPKVPLTDGPPTGRPAHEHRSSRADQRVWLERLPDEAATMELHSYCLDCGAVRSMRPLRGRPLGYFERALANLKADLEDNPRYPKLVQVHSRLIAKAFAAIPDFGDPYSMPFETQWAIFVNVIQRFRPDLDIDFIECTLPRDRKRPKPAYIDLVAAAKEEDGKPLARS